jgi:hypothetical protein
VLDDGHRTADLLRGGETKRKATSTQEMGALVHEALNEIIDRRQAMHAV